MPRPLKEVRVGKGIGVRRLSQGAPVSPRTVITTEKGESVPSFETIRKISAYLGVNPMEVTEFRAALEAQGLEGLPEEPAPPPPASPTATSPSPAEPGTAYGASPGPNADRGQLIEELLRLMRMLGREDVDAAYRLLFREPPGDES